MGTSNLSLLACGAPQLIAHAIRDHLNRFNEPPKCVSLTTSAWTDFIAGIDATYGARFKPESLNSCLFDGVRVEHSRRLSYSAVLTADSRWEDL